MDRIDPYVSCPVLTSEHFTLRLVEDSDAADLLACYSDPRAQELFNADNCTNDFRYSTLEEMQNCIAFFLRSYQNRAFIRWSILANGSDRAVGTIEMFDGERAVLRLDLLPRLETAGTLNELLRLCIDNFYTIFDAGSMITKAVPAATERIAALKEQGFVPIEIEGREHYYIHRP